MQKSHRLHLQILQWNLLEATEHEASHASYLKSNLLAGVHAMRAPPPPAPLPPPREATVIVAPTEERFPRVPAAAEAVAGAAAVAEEVGRAADTLEAAVLVEGAPAFSPSS